MFTSRGHGAIRRTAQSSRAVMVCIKERPVRAVSPRVMSIRIRFSVSFRVRECKSADGRTRVLTSVARTCSSSSREGDDWGVRGVR